VSRVLGQAIKIHLLSASPSTIRQEGSAPSARQSAGGLGKFEGLKIQVQKADKVIFLYLNKKVRTKCFGSSMMKSLQKVNIAHGFGNLETRDPLKPVS
jgi:hypothetical protein